MYCTAGSLGKCTLHIYKHHCSKDNQIVKGQYVRARGGEAQLFTDGQKIVLQSLDIRIFTWVSIYLGVLRCARSQPPLGDMREMGASAGFLTDPQAGLQAELRCAEFVPEEPVGRLVFRSPWLFLFWPHCLCGPCWPPVSGRQGAPRARSAVCPSRAGIW